LLFLFVLSVVVAFFAAAALCCLSAVVVVVVVAVLNGQRYETVVLRDVAFEYVGAGSQHAFKSATKPKKIYRLATGEVTGDN